MAKAMGEGVADKVATAQYISAMAKELRGMAAQSDLGFLSYLLALVEDEAGSMTNSAERSDSSADAA